MSRTAIISAFSAALEVRDFEQAATYLADNFTLSGPTPQPVGKHEFLAIQSAFQRAFPDWKFNLHEAEEQGDIVTGAVQITGTHTEDLVLAGIQLWAVRSHPGGPLLWPCHLQDPTVTTIRWTPSYQGCRVAWCRHSSGWSYSNPGTAL